MKRLLPLGFALGGWLCAHTSAAQCHLAIDQSRWEVMASDDFNGTTLDANKWKTQPPLNNPDPYAGWGIEYYDPSQVSVSGGAAHLACSRMANPVTYTAPTGNLTASGTRTVSYKAGMLFGGSVPANPITAFQSTSYGIWEASIKFPASSNTYPSFWLWCGAIELDIVDGIQYRGDYNLQTNVINNKGQSCSRLSKPWSPSTLTSAYHTYSMVWTPDAVSFYVDNREVRTVPRSSVDCQVDKQNQFPFLLICSGAVEDVGSAPDMVTDVDFVRIWKPKADASGVRNDNMPADSYKTANEFINHDLSTQNSVPVSADAGSIAINPDDASQAFYRGTDSRLYLTSGGSMTQVPDYTNSGVAGDVTYNGQQHAVSYRGNDNCLHSYKITSGGWQHDWLSRPNDPPVSSQPGSIAFRTTDGSFVYAGGDRRLHYWDAPNNRMATIPNYDGQGADVVGEVTLEQGSYTRTIYYRGADNRLQYYYWTGSNFQHVWLEQYSQAAYAVSSVPKSVTTHGNTVYYLGVDNKIQSYSYNNANNGWDHAYLLPTSYDYSQGGLGRGGLHCNPEGDRLTYLGDDGRLQVLYTASTAGATVWVHNWIDNYWITGEFLSFTSGNQYSSVITTTNSGTLQAFYCGQDNHLRYFKWEPCQVTDSQQDCQNVVSSGKSIRGTLHRGAATPLASTPVSSGAEALTVYPNPTTGRVSLQLPASSTATSLSYALYSALGQLLQQGTLPRKDATLSLETQPAGMYLLLLKGDAAKESYQVKLVKH